MHRAAAHAPARKIARLAQIDMRAQRRIAAIAGQRTLARDFAEAEHVGQDRGGRRGVIEQQGHAMKAADRVLGRNVAIAPARLVLGAGHADEREAHAVGIGEGQHGFAEALFQRLMRDALLEQPVRPVAERALPECGTRSPASRRPRAGRPPRAPMGKKVRIVPGWPCSSP